MSALRYVNLKIKLKIFKLYWILDQNKLKILPEAIIAYNKYSRQSYVFLLSRYCFSLKFRYFPLFVFKHFETRSDESIKIREISIKSFENLQKKNMIISQAELSDDGSLIVLVTKSKMWHF